MTTTIRFARLARQAPLTTCLALALCAGAAFAQTPARYEGLCDASAAIALDARHFVVASDEVNTLFIFDRDRPEVVGRVALDGFLRTGDSEADLESAGRIRIVGSMYKLDTGAVDFYL